MDKYQVLIDLMQDESKVREVISDSIEETQQNLKKIGLDFSIEELESISIKVAALENTSELAEETLDDVTGGVGLITTSAVACFALAAVAAIRKWQKYKTKR